MRLFFFALVFILAVSQVFQVTEGFFGGMKGEYVTPSDVFLSFAVDKDGNVSKVIDELGIPVLKCAAHHLNTAVVWAPGLAGLATCAGTE